MAKTKTDILGEIKTLQIELNKLSEKSMSLTQEEIKLQEKLQGQIVRRAREVRKLNEEQLKNKQSIIDEISLQERGVKSFSGIYSSIGKTEEYRVKLLRESGTEHKNNITSLGKLQSLNEQIANLSANDVIQRESLQSQFNQELNSLDKRGKGISEQITLLTHSNKLANQYAGLTEKQKDFLEKQLSVYNGIKDTIGGVLETARLLTSTTGGMFGSALIGAGFLVDKLTDAKKVLGQMPPLSTGLLSFIDGDAVDNLKELSNQFGGISDITMDMQISTSLISKNLGISGGEAANLLGSFTRLNGNSFETAENLVAATEQFAHQNGIIPADLMKDLANNTEAFALYGKDGGKNIIQAAGYAKKLGVEFSKLTGIADNLLDFESSITKELELGAMLGKNINLDRARALAFEGDIEGATKETLKALGGIEEFNKMDYFSKKATADLLGVSVEELAKMAANQEKANTVGGQLEGKFSKMAEISEYIATEWGGGILKTFGSGLIAVGQMGAGLSQMGIDVKGMAKSSFDFVKNLLAAGQSKVLGMFGNDKPASSVTDKAKDSISEKISGKKITETFSEKDSPIGKKGGIVDSMSKIKMNDVLKGAAALVIVAGAVFVLGKAMQEYADVGVNNILAAAGSILVLGLAMAGLGLLMNSPIGLAIFAGAAALLLMATSVLVLGNALQAIGTGFEMLSSGITNLLPNLVGVGETISSLVMFIPAITALSLSLMGLSASLVAVGAAGLLATPGLMALSTVGAIATGLGSVLGIGGDTTTDNGNETMKMLLDEIKGLRNDLTSGKVAVYMDGTAVTSKISKVVDRIGVNSYS